ncbi:MAG: cytochrome ubiquinol oxidase subunit I [Methylococcales bacterium]|nr:cytochrome ubiquinol oxidase subunit I [Methylococcales bacterium]
MISDSIVELSHWQFTLTSLYHFLFIPLTIGLSLLLAIMETCYIRTGKAIYKEMTQFWGQIFGVNFALSLATGLTIAFQFGMNWSYFSHYAGDVLGGPLAIAGLFTLFIESTFIALFFLGWDKLSPKGHLTVTWLVAGSANFLLLWTLIANSWLQNPVGSAFNYQTMRIELIDFTAILLNPIAYVKFIHTTLACYVTASTFVLSVAAYYMLNRRNLLIAKQSYSIATHLGLAAILLMVIFGNANIFADKGVQPSKLAAIKGGWHTRKSQPELISTTISNIIDSELLNAVSSDQSSWTLGFMNTRTIDVKTIELNKQIEINKERIQNGLKAHILLQQIKTKNQYRSDETQAELVAEFNTVKQDFGYGLLLRRYVDRIVDASDEHINEAATLSMPNITPLFWAFRIMITCSFMILFVFISAGVIVSHPKFHNQWVLRLSLYAFPLPWLASEMGWLITEFGRQPWTITGVLPTFFSISLLSTWEIMFSLLSYTTLYIAFLATESVLMIRIIKKGPNSLRVGLK